MSSRATSRERRSSSLFVGFGLELRDGVDVAAVLVAVAVLGTLSVVCEDAADADNFPLAIAVRMLLVICAHNE